MNYIKRLKPLWKIWGLFFICALTGVFGARVFGVVSVSSEKTKIEVSTHSEKTVIEKDVASKVHKQTAVPMSDRQSFVQRGISFAGIFVLIGFCFLMSNNKSKINWKTVLWGLVLQFVFAILVLKTAPGLWLFQKMNVAVEKLLGFTQEGSRFLFRSFISGQMENGLMNFTFNVLPTIIFFSSLMTVCYYLGIMQWVVKGFAVVMQKTMKCSGAETLSTAANIFVGQTEAPLVVKPYVKDMTKSEILTLMVGGFANTAGGVLAAYVGMLHQYFPDIAGHLIAQSVMSAPAALLCSKIVYPETESPITGENVKMVDEKKDANVIDAAARGASEGLTLAFNVAAMLLAFIALIALANAGIRKACTLMGAPSITLETIFGIPGAVLAFVMGVPWHDCWLVGKLIGVKTVVNEFVAYLQMAEYLKNGALTSYRSSVIASYALCSFANFSSIAIQIGGISGIAPNQRQNLSVLGMKAMITGAIASCMTAAIAGVLIQ